MIFRRALIIASFFAFSHCASEPIERDDSPITNATEIPIPARSRLWDNVLQRFHVETNVSKATLFYLEGIALDLYGATASRVRFTFVREKVPSFERGCWIFPGEGAIVDVAQFKLLSDENEVAAMIALCFEHSFLPSFSQRLVEEINPVATDIGRIINFLTEEDITAIQAAAVKMHLTGFDPRGLIGYLRHFKDFPADKSQLLEETARQTIFRYPPLVNPVGRTNKFYKFIREFEKN